MVQPATPRSIRQIKTVSPSRPHSADGSDDFDQFIKFINMLMSDTTFHLEESLTNLAKINQLQQQLAAGSVPEVDRADATSQLQQAEGAAPWHTQMGLDNVELIRDLTANSKEPFVVGEIVDRLAAVSQPG